MVIAVVAWNMAYVFLIPRGVSVIDRRRKCRQGRDLLNCCRSALTRVRNGQSSDVRLDCRGNGLQRRFKVGFVYSFMRVDGTYHIPQNPLNRKGMQLSYLSTKYRFC